MSQAATTNPMGPGADGPAQGLERTEGWAGEVRVNLLRLAALVAFYGYHLLNVAVSADATVGGAYHLSVTALAMVWAVGVAALYFLLTRGPPPPALKFLVTAWDLVMVTVLVMLAGGPRSPLVLLYFLVIAAAPLRLALPLVYVAALGSVAAYAFLLGHYAFAVVGYERYYASPELRVPRTQEAIFILALLGCGAFAAQAVRQAQRLGRHASAGTYAAGPAGAELTWAARALAGGLLVMAMLVGLGLLFPVLGIGGARQAGEGPAWPALLVLVAAFLVAVVAAVVEARTPHDQAAPYGEVPG